MALIQVWLLASGPKRPRTSRILQQGLYAASAVAGTGALRAGDEPQEVPLGAENERRA